MNKIIDIHAHAVSINKEETGCFVSESLMNTVIFRMIKMLFGIGNGDTPAMMDKKIITKFERILESITEIDYIVMLAFDGVYDSSGNLDTRKTHFYVANDYVKSLSEKYDKVIYGASVNPMRKDALNELNRVIKEGAALIKWLPNTQGINPSNPDFIDFYKMLAKNKMPLLVHTGREYGLSVIDQKFGVFSNLVLPLSLGVTVIAAHGGGISFDDFSNEYEKLIMLLKEYDNFYIDTSALFLLNKRGTFYKLAKQKDIHHKIVYGSDWPIPSNPLLFVKNAPVLSVFKSLFCENFIQRNYLLTKKIGFNDEIFYKGYKIIKKDNKFEDI